MDSYQIPQANFADLFFHQGLLYLTGVTFVTGTSQTFIAKYPI
jgi:hypothetical protein